MSHGIRRGHRSHDSVETCQYQNDLFHMIGNPHAPAPKRVVSASKDSIESLQTKLEEEARQQLLLNEASLAADWISMVAHLSRLIFMTLVFPPYFVCYSLPKFILFTVAPEMFLLIAKPVQRAVKQIRESVVRSLAFLKKVFFTGPKDAMKAFGELLVEKTVQPVVAAYYKCREVALRPFRYAKALVGRFKQSVIAIVKSAFDQSKRLFVRAGRRVSRLVSRQFEKISHVIDRFFARPVSDFCQPKWRACADLLGKVKRKISENGAKVAEALVYFAKNPKELIASVAQVVSLWLAQTVSDLRHPVAQWVKSKITEVASIGAALREKAYDLVADRYYLAVQELQLWIKTSRNATQHAAASLWASGVSLSRRTIGRAAEKISGWLEGRQKWGQQKYKQYHDLVASRAKEAIASLSLGVNRGVSEMLAIFRRWIHWLWHKLKVLPQHGVILFRQLTCSFLRVIRDAIYGLRVAAAWTTVLLRYGMQLVREAARKFTASLSAWLAMPK